jgi:hypothetical protein
MAAITEREPITGPLRPEFTTGRPSRPARSGVGRGGGWESLTATGRAVSLLVAERLTNGAVARRL